MDLTNLNQKIERDRAFHDAWAHTIVVDQICVHETFEAVTAIENRKALQRLGDLKGCRILDLGCGAGEAAVYFALQGAEVYAVDASLEMLGKSRQLAQRFGVNIATVQCLAEKLPFENDFFDCIYGCGVLHHADFALSTRQAARVLKPNGTAVFIEPLRHNPVVAVYRKLARSVMSPTEKAFALEDFRLFNDYFLKVEFEFCWFTTLSIFLYMYFIERIDDHKDRYWKRIIREHKRYEKMFRRFNAFDERLMKIFPFLKRFSWSTVITLSDKK